MKYETFLVEIDCSQTQDLKCKEFCVMGDPITKKCCEKIKYRWNLTNCEDYCKINPCRK